MEQTMVMTLEELTAEKAMVAVKASMKMGDQTMEVPAQKQTIPAKVTKEQADIPGIMGADSEKMKIKDKKEGKETIEVAGKKLETTTLEFTATMEGEKDEAWIKTWMTPEIPGGMAKMEMKTLGEEKMSMKMAVTEFKAKNRTLAEACHSWEEV